MEIYEEILVACVMIMVVSPIIYLNLRIFPKPSDSLEGRYHLYIYIYIYCVGTQRLATLREILGCIMWVVLMVIAITVVNVIDQKLISSERECWVIIFGVGIMINLFLLQPFKCILIYHCYNSPSPQQNPILQLLSARIYP